ncbi:autotransporter domain-containing protein, partial [Fusobacterium simiae]|nr:autotransporter domain-containing protein [Fusobacterium simiae]
AAPNISIPSFAPVAPQVEAPVIPPPPNILFVVGADCNNNCTSGNGLNRQNTNAGFLTANGLVDGRSKQNVSSILHYTWDDHSFNAPFRLPTDRGALAFKMWQEEGANFTGTPDKIYFNSYNFAYNGGTPEFGAIQPSSSAAVAGGVNKNTQPFFVGGSRFIEMDNTNATAIIPAGKTINLGGIYTLGMVSQENSATLQNNGTITDIEENQEGFIRSLPNTFLINPPTGSAITMKKSDDGYVGYKVGIVQVEENTNNGANTLINNGSIDFHGEKSLGMYIFLPNSTSNAVLYNRKNISLSGENSYGMKISAKTTSRVEMVNETGATITLQQNTTNNKKDKADNSVAMALMADGNVTNKVSLETGKAVNKGTITLKDNIANALGMFVNIDSDMTNQGTINVNTVAIDPTTKKYKPSVGMRANQVESNYSTAATFDTTVTNDTAGKISLAGQGNIGMLASGKNTAGPNGKGTAKAVNKGEININKGTAVGSVVAKDNYGMLAISEASVVNEQGAKITLGNAEGSVGMAALKEGTTHSTAENKGIITVNGAKLTGVYNTGHFKMDNANAQIDVKGSQSIGLYAKGTDATHTKTELKQGTITAANSGIGLYSDKATVDIDNSNNNLKLIANDGGLLFYNYDSGVSGTPVANGKFRLTGSNDATATINNGGYAFYLKNAQLNNGSVSGLAAFFNSMFSEGSSTRKLDITLNQGGTLMILDKPENGNIKLSSVSTTSSIAASLGNRVSINNASTKYKVYAVYRGALEIDQNVNLD